MQVVLPRDTYRTSRLSVGLNNIVFDGLGMVVRMWDQHQGRSLPGARTWGVCDGLEIQITDPPNSGFQISHSAPPQSPPPTFTLIWAAGDDVEVQVNEFLKSGFSNVASHPTQATPTDFQI